MKKTFLFGVTLASLLTFSCKGSVYGKVLVYLGALSPLNQTCNEFNNETVKTVLENNYKENIDWSATTIGSDGTLSFEIPEEYRGSVDNLDEYLNNKSDGYLKNEKYNEYSFHFKSKNDMKCVVKYEGSNECRITVDSTGTVINFFDENDKQVYEMYILDNSGGTIKEASLEKVYYDPGEHYTIPGIIFNFKFKTSYYGYDVFRISYGCGFCEE